MLVNVPKLVSAYYTEVPDPSVPEQRVAFGTSGHRGSSFDKAFNEWHILAISQAICLYRKQKRIDGPLFLGMDTHALSVPALASALEVLAAIRLTDGTRVRLISRRRMIEGHPILIRVGFSEDPMWERFWQLVLGLLVGFPLALGLAGFGGYYLARRALSPVERMARRAQEINAERLGARIDVENPDDELGLLAKAFNETLARLERSFEQLKRFTSDASHELRTPLTAIRSVGEIGIQQDGDRDYYREVIGSMLEETERLSRLVESLLTISRADSGQIRLEQTTIALLPMVREASSLLEVLAEEKRQTMSLEGDESIRVTADSVILRQVAINLLDNAIKYSAPEGHISIRVSRRDPSTACVEIKDSGPGIAPEHREKVFDRFYRIDEGRAREAGALDSAWRSPNGVPKPTAGAWNWTRPPRDASSGSFCRFLRTRLQMPRKKRPVPPDQFRSMLVSRWNGDQVNHHLAAPYLIKESQHPPGSPPAFGRILKDVGCRDPTPSRQLHSSNTAVRGDACYSIMVGLIGRGCTRFCATLTNAPW